MPNHVHVVFKMISKNVDLHSDLAPILHSWKSFTAKRANEILRREGIFWQREYYDHVIRSDEEFGHYVNYTLQNPVKAGLCNNWTQWPWSGCSQEIKMMMEE
jgi:REP element-mobilizing transposase RayT